MRVRALQGGWRTLGVFWLAVLAVAGVGAGTLQAMGPPRAVPSPAEPAPAAPLAVPPAAARPASLPAPAVPSRLAPDGVAAMNPALQEPAPDFPGATLPRIAADGQASMLFYAKPFDRADRRPRVAMLVSGLGMNGADSREAAETLPAAVSLAFSPYGHDLGTLLDEVRRHGHEFLVTVPMESQGYPLNNSGVRALMTGADPADNARNFEWVLSRMQGEVGLTGASDGLRGERFAASPGAIGPMLEEAARRGLLYVDPRPHAAASGPAVAVTEVVDEEGEEAGPAAVDAKLAELEQQARNGNPALGLALHSGPVTVERIAAWARGLDGRGVLLVPVSALAPGK